MATCNICNRDFDINDINESEWMEADDEGDICGECVRSADDGDGDRANKED